MKRGREGEEERDGRGARDRFTWHFAKQHEKDLIIGWAEGEEGWIAWRWRERGAGGGRQRDQERGKRRQKATEREIRENFIYITVFLKHRAHHHHPYQIPTSYSDPVRSLSRIHKKRGEAWQEKCVTMVYTHHALWFLSKPRLFDRPRPKWKPVVSIFAVMMFDFNFHLFGHLCCQ